MTLPIDRVAQPEDRLEPARAGRAIPARPIRRLGPAIRVALRLSLAFVLLVPLLGGAFGPPIARGDDLSDALARQKALQAQIAAQKRQVAELNAEQADLQATINGTKSKLNGINANLTDVKAQVKQTTAKVNAVQAAYNSEVAQLAALDTQIGAIVNAERVKADQLEARKNLLAQHIRDAYQRDRTSLLETILSADSFADVLNDVSSYIDIGNQDKALAIQIVADQQTLAALTQTVTDARVQTDQLRADSAAQKVVLDQSLADLKVAKAQLKALQAATNKQLALQKKAYQTLATNKAAAKKLLDQAAVANRQLQRKINELLAAQYNGGGIPSRYSGSFEWPVAGIVTQEFGCTGFFAEPPLGNCAHFHIGIDIAAPLGTPIHAAGPGKVLYTGPLSDGAWVVIIAHSTHLITLYGHVRTNIPVRAGQFVQAGQLIAYVGMTGNTTGPHLHWGVELNKVWVNPRLFL